MKKTLLFNVRRSNSYTSTNRITRRPLADVFFTPNVPKRDPTEDPVVRHEAPEAAEEDLEEEGDADTKSLVPKAI